MTKEEADKLMAKVRVDIMDGPKNLYAFGKKIEDITVLDTHARVLLKGKDVEISVPFSRIVWRSPRYDEVIR